MPASDSVESKSRSFVSNSKKGADAMKRCEICRSDYGCRHTVRPGDDRRPEAIHSSWALARTIEVTTSASPKGGAENEDRRGGRTILDDFREFLEDRRLGRFHFIVGAHGVELQLTRASISVGLFSFGAAAIFFALSIDVISGSIWRWLPDMLLAACAVGMIAPWRGQGPAASMVLTGVVLLARTLYFVNLSLWVVLAVAAGGCSLLYRRRVRVSGITLKFAY
jgi:hypothetical protein